MRSRIAIIAMLVFGLALSGGGVGLAISGPSTPAVTSQQGQYDDTDTNQVLGDVESGGSDDSGTPATDDSTGEVENQTSGGGGGVQNNESGAGTPSAAEQTTAESGSTLPFTGFAAIPVVLAGVALLAGGLVLRRRTITN